MICKKVINTNSIDSFAEYRDLDMGTTNLVKILGRRVVLTPILKEEVSSVLLDWRNSTDYQNLCSNRRYSVCLEDFEKELAYDFAHDRHEQYMIRKKCDMVPIGTIFSYNYNSHDGYAFITTFISNLFQSSVFGAEAHALMLKQLFDRYSLFKVYGEVYSHNKMSLKTMTHAGYRIEGVFVGHRKNSDGTRSDLIRLSMNCAQINIINDYIKRITSDNFEIVSFNTYKQ